MKHFFFHLIFFPLWSTGFSQSNFKSSKSTSLSLESERWGLGQYVWSHAQYKADNQNKPVIDFDAIENWKSLGVSGDVSISPNGQYFAYTIYNDRLRRSDTLVIQSTVENWRQTFTEASPGFFSGDNKQYIFKQASNRKKMLCFLGMGDDQPGYVRDVSSYKVPSDNKNQWIAFQLSNGESSVVLQNLIQAKKKEFDSVSSYSFDPSNQWLACEVKKSNNTDDKDLIIYNLNTEKERRFPHIAGYSFDASGASMLLKTIEKVNDQKVTSLYYVNLSDGSLHNIWSTTDSSIHVDSYSLDAAGMQAVFVIEQKGKSIWYWKEGSNKATNIVTNQTPGIDHGLIIQGSATFSNDRYIRFKLQPSPDRRKPGYSSVPVDVWSYLDTNLQSFQRYLVKQPKSYSAIFNLENEKVIQLETAYKSLRFDEIQGDYAAIFQSGKNIYGDRFWEKDYYRDSCWAVSLKDGSSKFVGWAFDRYFVSVSPDGNYLVFFNDDEKKGGYFSYNLISGKLTKISVGLPTNQFFYKNNFKKSLEKKAVGIAGWLSGEDAVLVYDNYDIWQLDLKSNTPAINITNGYGRKHNTVLVLMNSDQWQFRSKLVLSKSDTLLLRAFNKQNKFNGYYTTILGSNADPKPLFMGPYYFQSQAFLHVINNGFAPLKAADTNAWVVRRQTAVDAPNYYLTTDFKSYRQLTKFQPNVGFNWLTSKLHTYKQLDGTANQGILYKPENFDPKKKYPVIISFYSDLTPQLYNFPNSSYLEAPHLFYDPSWFVSHGYLIFLPDVQFTDGQFGPSTLNAVNGAALYLSQLPFVNKTHMAACGHSNSGTTGYYVLTHSYLFAAMSVGAGTSDMISRALSLETGEKKESELEGEEVSPYFTGMGNIWENKESWLDQTSVLHTDRVTSPLLMFHCEKDANPVRQAIEMFISLRRLEKKVWWLQYDNGSHGLFPGKDGQDYTIRTTQFYDHYLKDAPAPQWMTQGIPYALKEIEARFELDPVGSCGKDCPICKVWNEQYKRTPQMFTSALSEWKLDKDLRDGLAREQLRRYQINLAKGNEEVKNIVKRLEVKKID
jgi:dipeptidyl aminopeptidase/acylaminoacyl peptidase